MTKVEPNLPAKKKWEKPVLVRLGRIDDVRFTGPGGDQVANPPYLGNYRS